MAGHAQIIRKGLPSYRHTECARAFARVPRRGPVVCADPDMPLPFFQVNVRAGIFDRHAHAMSQKIWRPHLVHKLLVDFPASFFREALGLDQNIPSFACEDGQRY